MDEQIEKEIVVEGLLNEKALRSFPFSLGSMPSGWLVPTEMRILYTLAHETDGPILEIGSWLGRSTVSIAAGIRDSGRRKLFDTCDFGLTSADEWAEKLNEKFDRYIANDSVVRAIYQSGGSIATLIENLRRMDMLKYVTSIIRGDALSVPLRQKYRLVFCDTLHNEAEVRAYGDFLDGALSDGGWLVCDDVIDSTLGSILLEYVDLEFLAYSNSMDKYSKFAIGRKRSAGSHTK